MKRNHKYRALLFILCCILALGSAYVVPQTQQHSMNVIPVSLPTATPQGIIIRPHPTPHPCTELPSVTIGDLQAHHLSVQASFPLSLNLKDLYPCLVIGFTSVNDLSYTYTILVYDKLNEAQTGYFSLQQETKYLVVEYNRCVFVAPYRAPAGIVASYENVLAQLC